MASKHVPCDCMSFAYGEPRECSRKATHTMFGHTLCKRHAQSFALMKLVEKDWAKEIGMKAPTGLTFIKDYNSGGHNNG